MEILLALLIVLGATVGILNLGYFTRRLPFSVSKLEHINVQSRHQVLLAGIAILVLIALCLVNGPNLSVFFAPGNVSTPATGVSWLGIPEGTSWLKLGISLSFFITLATFLFVYLQFRRMGGDPGRVVPFIPWILLFSVTNSFSEEVVYRLGIIVPLAGVISPDYILLLSAIAFGAPHLRGMPNGIVGALMAGFLGWLLAKSVMETNGIFWAWFIHFLQDIVIFSALVMAAANKPQANGPHL